MGITGNGTDTMSRLLNNRKKELKAKLVILISGLIIGITSVVLTFIWYGWKLALILFLVELAGNLENSTKYQKKEK